MQKEIADEIICKYIGIVFRYVVKKRLSFEETEELSSEILYETYNALLKVSQVRNIDAFVYKIAKDNFMKYKKKLSRQNKIMKDLSNIMTVESDSYTDNHDIVYVSKKLHTAISTLSFIHKKIVMLHYFEGKKLKEISDAMNIPLGTIKWHLFEAKKQLKTELEYFKMDSKENKPAKFYETVFMKLFSTISESTSEDISSIKTKISSVLNNSIEFEISDLSDKSDIIEKIKQHLPDNIQNVIASQNGVVLTLPADNSNSGLLMSELEKAKNLLKGNEIALVKEIEDSGIIADLKIIKIE